MPNWCSNSITITGNVETIKTLWEATQTGDDERGLLNAIYPEPEDIGDEWYGWRVEHWGTKWEVSSEGLEFADNGDGTASISGWFDSAWAPPIGVYERFAEQFDSCVLEASYYEPGMDFAGFWSSENGDEYLEGIYGQCELPEDEQSDLFKRLDEEYNLQEQFEEMKEF
jgi:hypothetical protein